MKTEDIVSIIKIVAEELDKKTTNKLAYEIMQYVGKNQRTQVKEMINGIWCFINEYSRELKSCKTKLKPLQYFVDKFCVTCDGDECGLTFNCPYFKKEYCE